MRERERERERELGLLCYTTKAYYYTHTSLWPEAGHSSV